MKTCNRYSSREWSLLKTIFKVMRSKVKVMCLRMRECYNGKGIHFDAYLFYYYVKYIQGKPVGLGPGSAVCSLCCSA